MCSAGSVVAARRPPLHNSNKTALPSSPVCTTFCSIGLLALNVYQHRSQGASAMRWPLLRILAVLALVAMAQGHAWGFFSTNQAKSDCSAVPDWTQNNK